jgi:hypothetical protein
MLRRCAVVVLLVAGLATGVSFALASESELDAPVLVHAKDGPIDVLVGHAAPFLHDMDGDGLADLLVGEFGSGGLRHYRNVGVAGAPKFDDFAYFQADGKDASVPAG